MAKIKIVCAECEGENVVRDAWASWDVETQKWEASSVFDDARCEDCDREVSLNEVEIVDPRKAALDALSAAQDFMNGFADDETQEGIGDMLDDIGAAMKGLEEGLAHG